MKVIPALVRRKLAETGAQSSDEVRLLESFEKSVDGWFWATDAHGRLRYLSDNISRWLAGGGRNLIGSDFFGLVEQADLPSGIRRALPIMMSRPIDFEKVQVRLRQSREENWWSISGFVQLDEAGQFRGYVGVAIDMTEQQRSYERAARLAMYDTLTGLPNRLSMATTLQAALDNLDPVNGSCAALMLDLDRFKQVNDTLGHQAGDALLKLVAERILSVVGKEHCVFRLGGDEFKIILPRTGDRSLLSQLATKLIESLSQPYFVGGSRCVIGTSIGIAVAPFDGRTSEELIRNVDLALYAAKASGRGRYRMFSDELLRAAEERRILEEDLRDALARGEIFLAYQPVVSAVDNRLTGVEALMRWDHPQRGIISPSTFIAIAEESGFVEQLGTWALRQACADAATWPAELGVAVNVSPIQFSNRLFPELVMSALASSGLSPERLELEVTEGVFLNESEETHATFKQLKAIGVQLALDDFGTGYASLGYLRSAPFDRIKIDQSFVQDVATSQSRNGAIVTAIVALAEALGMETTAEGIETTDQLELIRKLGVSHIQGFVYGKPLTYPNLIERLDAGSWLFTPSGPPRQRSKRHTVFRKAAVIHGSQYCAVLIRNLSESGALIDGIDEAPIGSRLLIDFGGGQLTLGVVRRVSRNQHGVEFEQALVSDGDGGLCTGRRVSPQLLDTVGLPVLEDASAIEEWHQSPAPSFEHLCEQLGIDTAIDVDPPAEPSGEGAEHQDIPTLKELAERYITHIQRRGRSHEVQLQHLEEHILPEFGDRRIDQVNGSQIEQWLAAKRRQEGLTPATALRITGMVSYMFKLAQRWNIPGGEANPIPRPANGRWRIEQDISVAAAILERLQEAARSSTNAQLTHVVTLLLETGVDTRDLLVAKWSDIDLKAGLWRIPLSIPGPVREVSLSETAQQTIAALSRWPECPYLIANPRTRRPFKTLAQSWDSVRKKAGLPTLSIDDLRYLIPGNN